MSEVCVSIFRFSKCNFLLVVELCIQCVHLKHQRHHSLLSETLEQRLSLSLKIDKNILSQISAYCVNHSPRVALSAPNNEQLALTFSLAAISGAGEL